MWIASYALVRWVFKPVDTLCENSPRGFGDFFECRLYSNKQVFFLIAVQDLVEAEYPNLQFYAKSNILLPF